MSNVFETIGHDLAAPFKWLGKAEQVIAIAIKDQPELKTAVTQLVSKVEGLIGDGSIDVAEKGLNVVDDAKTLADLQAFGSWFKASFITVVEQVYTEVKTDLAS